MRFSRLIAIPAIFCIFFVSSSPSTANGFLDTLMEDVTEAVETAKESIEEALPGAADSVDKLLPGLVSGALAQLLSGGDLKAHEVAILGALVTGAAQSWNNPETGNSGGVKVLEESTTTEETKFEVLKDKVEQVPPLEMKGTNFTAIKSSNIRGGPGTDYKVVGKLPAGNVVMVVGKVKGSDWYMISQGDVATGFVSAGLLEETPTATVTSADQPDGDVETVQATADQTCKTVEQSVTQDDGTTKTEVIKACQGPNGWQIVS